jgi:hypothetical protein
VASFYVAALVAAKQHELAKEKLLELTKVITKSNLQLNPNLDFGFNEWLKAQNGEPMGENWQTWSAAMYLYAAKCVEEKRTRNTNYSV